MHETAVAGSVIVFLLLNTSGAEAFTKVRKADLYLILLIFYCLNSLVDGL